MNNIKKIDELYKVVYNTLFNNGSLGYNEVLENLEKLAELVRDTPTEEGFCDLVGRDTECNLGSLFVGAYWYLTDHDDGQWSDSYRVLCRIGEVYNPGCENGPEPESMEQDAYEAFERLYEN